MAARPDFLPYTAQSFPTSADTKAEMYVPPADYPKEEPHWLKIRARPRSPPADYALLVSGYPYSNFAEGQYPKSALGPKEPPIDYMRRKPSTLTDALDLDSKARGNRAFLHHLKNHQKFDTYRSFRTCDGCPVCQAMEAADDAFHISRRNHHRYGRPDSDSPILSGKIYRRMSGISEDDEDEDGPNQQQAKTFLHKVNAKGTVVARVMEDRVGRKMGELTVAKGELLEILLAKKHWWSCTNAGGQVGWVPSWIMEIVKN